MQKTSHQSRIYRMPTLNQLLQQATYKKTVETHKLGWQKPTNRSLSVRYIIVFCYQHGVYNSSLCGSHTHNFYVRLILVLRLTFETFDQEFTDLVDPLVYLAFTWCNCIYGFHPPNFILALYNLNLETRFMYTLTAQNIQVYTTLKIIVLNVRKSIKMLAMDLSINSIA